MMDSPPLKKNRMNPDHDSRFESSDAEEISKNYSNSIPEKGFNDPIHGHIIMEPICVSIIDTPQFQRLRFLRQLGTCFLVFPGTNHTRFEHSLGVAHLAERMVKGFMQRQPELGITSNDLMCVKLAGLCHDLGHGPFSHVFDGEFIARTRKDSKKWRHEDGSVRMFRYILSANNIDLKTFGLSHGDQTFIEEMIHGTVEIERRGRPPTKFFLYDVVNNIHSGLDVDKMDYFVRDAKMANVGAECIITSCHRFISEARVMRAVPIVRPADWDPFSQEDPFVPQAVEEFPMMICFPEKLVSEAAAFFSTRFKLHHKLYTNAQVKQCEYMLVDIMEKANEFIRIPGTVTVSHPDGKYKITEVVEDMAALAAVNDSILDVIRLQDGNNDKDNDGLQSAKDLICRLLSRKLYRCIGRTPYTSRTHFTSKSENEIRREIVAAARSFATTLSESDSDGGSGSGSGKGCGKSQDEFVMFSCDATNDSSDDYDLPATQDEYERELIADVTRSRRRMVNNTDSATGAVNANVNVPSETTSRGRSILGEDDIIVEKMRIHHGLQDLNPVSILRFFPKNAASDAVAKEVEEQVYESFIPRRFEDRAVRVFCRDPSKEFIARQAFEKWCRDNDVNQLFPSCSQE
eukprot:gene5036-10087_t